ncbi:hypothetical protein NQD34_013092 [Periophthalmus magnuspinnatus]|nr:hypothetical protein NQD34_013092 [Periophthalmus magnuspinnatus]
MQGEVEESKQKILQQIQDREWDLKILQEEHENIGRSADAALVDIWKNFTQFVSVMEKQINEITQQIKTQQESEQQRIKDHQEKLQQEIVDLKVKFFDLDNLPDNSAPLKIKIPPSSPRICSCTLRYFADFPTAVASLTSKLQQTLSEDFLKISQTIPEVLLSKPQLQPKIRSEFLQYSRSLTLDPNTAHTMLLLSNDNQKVIFTGEHQTYSQNSERFTHWPQVLSRESLPGRSYFEVDWVDEGVYVALALKSIKRQGNSYECVFGSNEKSWALCCTKQSYSFMYNGVKTKVKFLSSQRIGVYLDYAAGILCFYSIFTDRVVLLRKVVFRFSEPLHVGLRLWANESTASLSLL